MGLYFQEDVGELPDIGSLEVEEVEEGGVVHGGRGPSRRGLRRIGGEAMCEEGGRGGGRGAEGGENGEDAGREGLGHGAELGLARRARRGGLRRADGLE